MKVNGTPLSSGRASDGSIPLAILTPALRGGRNGPHSCLGKEITHGTSYGETETDATHPE